MCRCCCVTDLTVRMDFNHIICYHDRFGVKICICTVAIKPEKNIFYSFNKLSSYGEISQVEFDLQLQTDDKLSLYGHYKSCQKLMSNSLYRQYSYI